MRKTVVFVFCFLLFFVASCAPALAKVWKFSWDANTEPDVAGYYIHYSKNLNDFQGGVPPTKINVGNNTWYCLTLPDTDTDGYVGVTAYDTFGNVSGYSIAPLLYGDVDRPCEYNGTGFAPPVIDGFDLNIIGANFGKIVTRRTLDCNTGFAINCALDSTNLQRADINGDGVVDGYDLSEMARKWGWSLPAFSGI